MPWRILRYLDCSGEMTYNKFPVIWLVDLYRPVWSLKEIFDE